MLTILIVPNKQHGDTSRQELIIALESRRPRVGQNPQRAKFC